MKQFRYREDGKIDFFLSSKPPIVTFNTGGSIKANKNGYKDNIRARSKRELSIKDCTSRPLMRVYGYSGERSPGKLVGDKPIYRQQRGAPDARGRLV
ncbi:hypothetical protein EVAR_75161_1 [Eumeta japonica]|uniref:Uncharacterized protein n=1 Tax=Eumeta variegata TaxID=151549 RepID=A0A4C1U0X8_EUMVA|nr:hypothetical protein EVAR_75161_1 [Eumeta japonica]